MALVALASAVVLKTRQSKRPIPDPIYHVARSYSERKRDEPGATTGDTEYSICSRYRISYGDFRRWNSLPAVGTIVIAPGRRYIVGFTRSDAATATVTAAVDRQLPAHLQPSQKVLDYIRSRERPPINALGEITGQAYRDTKQRLTIGYGRYIKSTEEYLWAAYNPEVGGTLEFTLEQMHQMFAEDVERLAVVDIRRVVTSALRQQEYDALVDFVYHRGIGALIKSGIAGHINAHPAGDFSRDTMVSGFMAYAKWFNEKTGKMEQSDGFERRRADEINMFFDGIYANHRRR